MELSLTRAEVYKWLDTSNQDGHADNIAVKEIIGWEMEWGEQGKKEKMEYGTCYALIVPSDRGLSRSEVTSITTVVICDPIRIKGSLRTW